MSVSGPSERRREAGASSARSLLLTVLGEFVLPGRRPVWTGSLVAALGEIGIEDKTARQAIARVAHERVMEAEREGRRTRWRLTTAGIELLREGSERIYSFGRQVADWDGRWLMLAVSVPESHRQVRHKLRTRLTWAGLGSPLPGLWLTPDPTKDSEVHAVVAALGVHAFSCVGPFGKVGDPQQVVADSWNLTDVEASYRAFLADFASPRVGPPPEAFASQLRLVQAWRRFPFVDPALPKQLLPATWPGQEAAELFHRRHDQWHSAAQSHWGQLQADAAQRL